jgi:hypothetical protein
MGECEGDSVEWVGVWKVAGMSCFVWGGFDVMMLVGFTRGGGVGIRVRGRQYIRRPERLKSHSSSCDHSSKGSFLLLQFLWPSGAPAEFSSLAHKLTPAATSPQAPVEPKP